MSIYERAFWRDTGERVVSSAAQGFLTGSGLVALAVATDTVTVATPAIEWKGGGLAALSMGVLALGKALVAGKANPESGASFAKGSVQLRPEQDVCRPPRRRHRSA